MRKIVLLELEGTVISVAISSKKDFFNSDAKKYDLSKSNFEFMFDNFDYGVNLFVPVDDGNNFLIKYLCPFSILYGKEHNGNAVGMRADEAFSILDELGFIDMFRDVYKTGKIKELRFECYDDGSLIYSARHKIFLNDNTICHLIKNETDLYLINKRERDVFDNSVQGMVIVQDNKVVRANYSFVKMLKTSIKGILRTPISSVIVGIKNSKVKEDFSVILEDILNRRTFFYEAEAEIMDFEDSPMWIKEYIIPVTYNQRPAIQINCIDITEQKLMQERMVTLVNDLNTIQNRSKLAIVHKDDEDYIWTSEIYNILELDSSWIKDTKTDLIYEFLLDEDKKVFQNSLNEAFVNKEDFDDIIRVKTAKGNIKYLSNYIKFNFEESNQTVFAGFVQDVSEIVSRETKLEQMVDDKKILLQEVHHRVKNNLQIILSLLNLEQRFYPDEPHKVLEQTHNRINSMAFMHEKIYQSSDLAHVNIKEYIETSISSIFSMYNVVNIDLNMDVVDLEISMDTAIPLGLIINEIIHNTIKYAFPDDQKGNLNISLKKSDGTLILIIEDDGVGIPDDVDVTNSPSLGLTVVNNLTNQINGSFSKLDKHGAALKIEFPFVQHMFDESEDITNNFGL